MSYFVKIKLFHLKGTYTDKRDRKKDRNNKERRQMAIFFHFIFALLESISKCLHNTKTIYNFNAVATKIPMTTQNIKNSNRNEPIIFQKKKQSCRDHISGQ